MEDPLDLLEKYTKQMEMDTQFDVTNLSEKITSRAFNENKWFHRLMCVKRDLIKLIETKESYIAGVMDKDNPLQLSKSVMSKKIESQAEYRALLNKIKEQEILLEYLDRSADIIKGMSYDFTNMVNMLKQESI